MIACIGAGQWGKNLIRNFDELGVLSTICEASPQVREEFAGKYPAARVTGDFESILTDPDIAAVSIATPAETHGVLVRKALEAGKDVFVEKPLALDLTEAEALVRLASEKDRILMVGHLLWYHPAVLRLKQLIDDGELGRIRYIYSNRLNFGKIRREENILWSFAPHDISVILGLLDEMPHRVEAQGANYLHERIADVTISNLSFPSGVKGHIFVSWLHPFKEQKLVVVGERKMAVFNDMEPERKLVLYPHEVAWQNGMPVARKADGEAVEIDRTEPLKNECMHFIECIRTRSTPRTDGREGVRVLQVLQRCQERMQRPFADTTPTPTNGAPTEDRPYRVHETAWVDDGVEIGDGTAIWHFSNIQKGARIGRKCSFGQNVNVGNDVVIGDNVKVQNNVSIYTGCEIEDDVFLGPSCVLTNVTNPRSQVNRRSLYEKTLFRRGATVGANATIVCGVTLGRYCFVAAGSVVTKDVPDYALVVGNPARQRGWMSRHGHVLPQPDADGISVCPESGFRYRIDETGVRCLDVDEEAPLPTDVATGSRTYDEFKTLNAESGTARAD